MSGQHSVQLTVTVPDGSTPYVLDLRNADDHFDSFDPTLREAVAAAIRRYPNTDADWWIGPEAVLGVIEAHLARRSVDTA